MSSFQQEIKRYVKKQECVIHIQGKKQATGTYFEKVHMLNWEYTDFKAPILNMFKQLKETT